MEEKKIKYVTPMVRIVEISSQTMICTSGQIKSMEVDEDAGKDFE